MASRRVYKSLELGINKGTEEPEAAQSFRMARKVAVSNDLSLGEVIRDSGEYAHTPASAAKKPKAPPAPKAPPKQKAPPKMQPEKLIYDPSKLPNEFGMSCKYKKSIYTKATAMTDALRRLKTKNIQEITPDKKAWIFIRMIPQDYLQNVIYENYSNSERKTVGVDKDILYEYMPFASD